MERGQANRRGDGRRNDAPNSLSFTQSGKSAPCVQSRGSPSSRGWRGGDARALRHARKGR